MPKIIYNIIALGIVFYISPVVQAEAPIRQVKDFTIKETIAYYAKEYGASEKELLLVANCESGFRPTVYGDGGRAYSIYQFHKPTFNAFSKMKGEDLDYYSAHDQIKLASWMFGEKPSTKSHWTCSKKMGVI